MSEEWKPVCEFPEYLVSNIGQIRRGSPDRKNHIPRILKTWSWSHGYPMVGLVRDGRRYTRLVHRVVCEAFHGPPPTEFHQAAHGDGSRDNCRADNLRWATRSENMGDCVEHGTRAMGARHGRTLSPEKTPRGEKHGHAKITERDVMAIRSTKPYVGSGRALAEMYGVSVASISLIVNRKTWVHIL